MCSWHGSASPRDEATLSSASNSSALLGLGAAEALVVDGGVDGLGVLLGGLASGVQAYRIGPNQDPWPVLLRELANPALKRLHLLGHGRPGELVLGRLRLRERWLRQFAPLQRSTPLEAICFWSCHTGSGAAGLHFIQRVADLTGSVVFAATTPVGASSHGGSWSLSVRATPSLQPGRSLDASPPTAPLPPLQMSRAGPSPATSISC